MFIVDAQVHIWAPSTPQRPWRPNQEPHRKDPLGADELLREMDNAGIARAVLISPYWDGPRNDIVLQAAHQHPERFAAMTRLDNDPPPVPGMIAKLRDTPGMLGLRCSFTQRQGGDGNLDDLEWVWDEAEEGGIPIMIMVPHAKMPTVDRVAERHPGLNLIMSHLGVTRGQKDAAAFRDLDKLLALSKRPNVAVKASAMPTYTSDPYPYRSLQPYLRRVYDSFGPRRMLWGTDFSRLRCSYRQAVTMFTEEIPWLTADDKEWIMGKAACKWLRWGT